MPLDYDNGLTHQIIGLAMRVHTRVGPGLLESVYARCLCHQLAQANLPFARQVGLPLQYGAVRLDCGYRADIIVNPTGWDHAVARLRAVVIGFLQRSRSRRRLRLA